MSRRRDIVIGLAGAAVAVITLLLEEADWATRGGPLLLLGVGLMVLCGGALGLRQRTPLAAGLLSAGAWSLASALEYEVFVPNLVSALVVGVCAAYATRRSTLVLAGAVAALAVALNLYESLVLYEESVAASYLVGAIALAAVPVAIGDAFRVRRELATEAEARAARLERLRELELEQAVDAERLRIARDVHDTVGHHLSAIAIQAGAGEQLAEDGDAPGSLRTLATIRDLTGNALTETRRLLGLVRTEAERRPPGLAGAEGIGDLVRNAERGGLAVEVRRLGADRPLDGVIGDCAYRIVQEALTNVSRHAAADGVLVELRYGAEALELLVEDDGRGSGPHRLGHGLVGMRERAAMAGGELSVGPGPDGGWRVWATLPYEPVETR